MTAYRAGSFVLATDIHGFTPLEIESIEGETVTVIIDPRVGVKNVRGTVSRDSITHVRNSSEWEYIR